MTQRNRKMKTLSILLGIAFCAIQAVWGQNSYPALLQKAFSAHGSLDQWKSFRSVEITLGSGDSQTQIQTDLQNRHELVISPKDKMGYDGNNYWYYAASIPDKRPNARFVIGLQFYFFSMPFVVGDPGIVYEELGKKQMEGKTYDVLKVTYGSNVGQSPKDQYLLFFDEATHLLHALLYSVTFFDVGKSDTYNARIYDEWQEIEGLKVPLKMTSYVWDAEKQVLGAARGSTLVTKVKFGKEAFDEALFRQPTGAVVD